MAKRDEGTSMDSISKDFSAFEPAVEEKLKEKIDTMDLWNENEVETKLAGLVSGCVAEGHSFVYRLWKSALNYWLKKDMNVVIVSPFIDSERLLDVMTLKMANKKKGTIHSIYIRDDGNVDNILDDKKMAARSYYPASSTLVSFLRSEVFSKIKNIVANEKPTRYFHCKFIAGIKDGEASVLSGSANFQTQHFDCMHDGYENLENIAYLTMPEQTFKENYLNPLIDLEERSFVMDFADLPGMD